MAKGKSNKEAVKALGWDGFSCTTKGLALAVKEVQGIPFVITQDYHVTVYCDDAGLFTTAESIGNAKKNGNYSDYGFTRIIATLVGGDMDNVPMDIVKNDIVSAPTRVKFTDAAMPTIQAVNWETVYEELLPYLEGIQSLNVVETIKQ